MVSLISWTGGAIKESKMPELKLYQLLADFVFRTGVEKRQVMELAALTSPGASSG